MKKINSFTDEGGIKRLPTNPKPTVYYYAGKKQVPGRLAVRVSPKNKKTFIIHYYADGKSKRYTLGEFPVMSLKAAKIMAEELAGTDPVKEKAARAEQRRAAEQDRMAEELVERSRKTMTDLWDKYSSLTKTKQKSPKTLREEERKWRVDIEPVIGDVPVKDITPEMIDNLLERMAKRSPVAANRVYSLLRVIFKPALKSGWITVHPMQWLEKPSSESPRKRVLTDDEIKSLWPYLETTKPNSGDILKIVLLSCQRPGEICSMRWADLDLDARIWHQEKNKTGVVNLVPISDQMFDILNARERENEWVFPVEGSHVKHTGWARSQIQKKSGITGWTAHDLRRSGRTIMLRLEIDHYIRERVLNHGVNYIAGVYDQHDYFKEKTVALKKLGNEIWHIIGRDVEPAKVVPLRAQG